MSASSPSASGERLAVFLPSLRGGGAERVMLTLARGFAERAWSVDLVLVKVEGAYVADVPDAVRVVDLDARRTIASLPALVRYLRRERPRALLSAMDHANVVALLARRLAGTPDRVIATVHIDRGRAGFKARSLVGRLTPLWVRPFYSWAESVVAVSSGVARDLVRSARVPEDRVQVIYNPVVTPEMLAQADEQLAHPWFRPDASPVVLGVGRLTAQKDFGTLIRAFALLRRRRPIRLTILGEGEERQELEALARELGVAEDVALPGFVDNPYQYMARAAVFALSSQWEGLPTVLIEALALGTPVVATDCPSGPSEILEEGRWGTLVPPGSVTALAGAVEESLERGALRDMERASRVAWQRFSVDAALDSYASVLVGDL